MLYCKTCEEFVNEVIAANFHQGHALEKYRTAEEEEAFYASTEEEEDTD